MTRTFSLLTCLLTLLAFSACGRAAVAADEAPALLDDPAPAPLEASSELDPHGAKDAGKGGCQDSTCGVHGCQFHQRYALGKGGAGRCCPDCLGQRFRNAATSGQPLVDPWARADWRAAQQMATQSWHAGYYNTQYGAPVAYMVPPTARMQTRSGWGVCQTTMSPIYPQFKRPYPGPVGGNPMTGGAPHPLLPTPRWPSHTDQFGVYYVRSPW